MRDDASIVPYKFFAAFVAIGKVSPRRDEGIAPYRAFIGWQRMINHSVGNGLDRSGTLLYRPYPKTSKSLPHTPTTYFTKLPSSARYWSNSMRLTRLP